MSEKFKVLERQNYGQYKEQAHINRYGQAAPNSERSRALRASAIKAAYGTPRDGLAVAEVVVAIIFFVVCYHV